MAQSGSARQLAEAIAASMPVTISADTLAVRLTRAWNRDGTGPNVPGIKVRQFVRTYAVGIPALEHLAERPAFGNRSHVYLVPEMTDPIVRGLAARLSARAGVTLPLHDDDPRYDLSDLVIAEPKPARKPAKAPRKPATARKRPQGGSTPPQTMVGDSEPAQAQEGESQ